MDTSTILGHGTWGFILGPADHSQNLIHEIWCSYMRYFILFWWYKEDIRTYGQSKTRTDRQTLYITILFYISVPYNMQISQKQEVKVFFNYHSYIQFSLGKKKVKNKNKLYFLRICEFFFLNSSWFLPKNLIQDKRANSSCHCYLYLLEQKKKILMHIQ